MQFKKVRKMQEDVRAEEEKLQTSHLARLRRAAAAEVQVRLPQWIALLVCCLTTGSSSCVCVRMYVPQRVCDRESGRGRESFAVPDYLEACVRKC
jgi:hypothetical protein